MKTTNRVIALALLVAAWMVAPTRHTAPVVDHSSRPRVVDRSPAPLGAAMASPAPAAPAESRVTPATWIEPGTPPEYLRAYLPDFVPVAIHRDGRQVYEGLPMTVRDPDGSLRSVPTRVELEPTAVAPLDPSEFDSAPR